MDYMDGKVRIVGERELGRSYPVSPDVIAVPEKLFFSEEIEVWKVVRRLYADECYASSDVDGKYMGKFKANQKAVPLIGPFFAFRTFEHAQEYLNKETGAILRCVGKVSSLKPPLLPLLRTKGIATSNIIRRFWEAFERGGKRVAVEAFENDVFLTFVYPPLGTVFMEYLIPVEVVWDNYPEVEYEKAQRPENS